MFASLELALSAEIYGRLHPDWRTSQRHGVEAACTSDRIRTWVTELDSRVIGFVAVELHQDRSIGEIYMMAVDPDFQGAGIGTSLTEFALDRIAEAGMTIAMVETGGDSGHAAARRTYEKAGYALLPIARYFKAL